jgi:hypothetical protein
MERTTKDNKSSRSKSVEVVHHDAAVKSHSKSQGGKSKKRNNTKSAPAATFLNDSVTIVPVSPSPPVSIVSVNSENPDVTATVVTVNHPISHPSAVSYPDDSVTLSPTNGDQVIFVVVFTLLLKILILL